MDVQPVFFELGWGILSTIGTASFFLGLLVVNVTGFSPIASVPLISSVACAVANGLCFYAYYSGNLPTANKAVAAAFADMLWGIQEMGLSFYSYVILSRVLRGRRWQIFVTLFWAFIVSLFAVRILIAVTRVRYIVTGNKALQVVINHLHLGYFPLLATLECVSAYYLLTTFARAQRNSLTHATKTGVFRYLMRSTEVRIALLALVGIMRAITYSFQVKPQRALDLASQLDRFAYTLECMFPVLMLIDMLSSKVVATDIHYEISMPSEDRESHHQQPFVTSRKDDAASATRRGVHVVKSRGVGEADSGFGGGSSSRNRSIPGESSSMAASSDVGLETMGREPGGIGRPVGASKDEEIEPDLESRGALG
ncbi:hypothetical protein NEMBOFW57_009989 [Staphylotrichum longicolle]|uniref:Uncharacterized protein n=1 Tax=Staphylotrichum longicolle TaxID=669026 RepID=A0AAD4HY86_9PEZI|nr:hypothetical protein NEMBOFW57_009989 [Staphylotrichum longicolle]